MSGVIGGTVTTHYSATNDVSEVNGDRGGTVTHTTVPQMTCHK